MSKEGHEKVPEGIAYHEEGYIFCLCIFEDLVTAGLDELAAS